MTYKNRQQMWQGMVRDRREVMVVQRRGESRGEVGRGRQKGTEGVKRKKGGDGDHDEGQDKGHKIRKQKSNPKK